MAEEKKEEVKGWKKYIKYWDEIVLAGIAIPFARDVMEKLTKKGTDVLVDEVSKVFGIKVEESGKGIGDEVIFRKLLAKLDENQRKEVENYRSKLKEFDDEKAKAFILFAALVAKAGATPVEKTKKLGKSATEKTTREVLDFDSAKSFLIDVISIVDPDKQVEFDKRLKFLEDENVFSLIKKRAEINESISNVIRKFLESMGTGAQKVGESLGETIEKLANIITSAIDEAPEKIQEAYKLANKEAESAAKWIDKNIHKKVEYRGFWREAFWFIPSGKNRNRRKKKRFMKRIRNFLSKTMTKAKSWWINRQSRPLETERIN